MKKRYVLGIILIIALIYALLFVNWSDRFLGDKPEIKKLTPEVKVTPTLTPTPTPVLEGEASWYSEDGCLGCSETLTMANGQMLDDNKLTVACRIGHSCEIFDLGDVIRIVNKANGESVVALVTDRGGLREGRILDVTKAVKGFLKMEGNGQISVYLLDNN